MSEDYLMAMVRRTDRIAVINQKVTGLSAEISMLAEEAERLGKEVEYISVNHKVPELAPESLEAQK